mgnify:FL=1
MVYAIQRGLLPLLLLLQAGIQPVAAQTSSQSPPVQSPAAPADLRYQFDLDKIRDRVYSKAPVIFMDHDTMRIYVNTVAPFPKFSDIVGSFDLFNGPTPYASMSHNEMVQMSRPKDMYSSGGLTAGDMLRFAALTYVEGKAFELLKKAAIWMRAAKTEAERKEIQARIERELAALKGNPIK